MKKNDKVFSYKNSIMRFGTVVDRRMIDQWLHFMVLWSESGQVEELRRDQVHVYDKSKLIKLIENT
jgi:hypothetical protein